MFILVGELVCLAGPGPRCVGVDTFLSSCLMKGHLHGYTWPP